MADRFPFFGNTPDDLHCLHASLRMVLKHFEPNADYSWEALDEIIGFRPGNWTWPTRAMLWLKRRGYEIRSIESVNSQRLAMEGRPYFAEQYGADVAAAQFAHCDFEQEMELLKQYLAEVEIPEHREPQLQDIRHMLRDGFVPIVNVNSGALNGRNDYVGHFVVLLGADLKRIRLHDPGLPHFPNRLVKFPDFEKAWAYPDLKAKNLTGIRRGR